MIKSLIIVLFIYGPQFIVGQSDYKGIVYDAKTSQPIPYVNIGILSAGVGTVSDENGKFHIELNPNDYKSSDTLQFSSMGYQTIRKAVKDLKFVLNEYPSIKMQPKAHELSEVVVTNNGSYEFDQRVGYRNYGEKVFGYWKDNVSLGGELATKIEVKKGLRRLNSLFFEIWANPSDSVLVRVNVYNESRSAKRPDSLLNTSNKNILYTIKSDTKGALIDLSSYNIYVKDDFIVSLELLKVYGEEQIGLTMAASNEGISAHSYRKYASHAKWELLEGSAMAYYLNTTYFTNKKKYHAHLAKHNKIADKQQVVSGFVFSLRNPLKEVKVTNYVTQEIIYTNEKGQYSIKGTKGDLLGFEYPGKKKVVLKILKKPRINISMKDE